MDIFAKYHPLVNFLYFLLVITASMLIDHPVSIVISFVCAFAYAVQTEGIKAVLFALKICLPVMLLTAVFNPAFSHQGVTILTYLPTGNPLTMESLLYGASAGAVMATVMLWFLNFNRVITSDKVVYLFGKMIPALSLVISMSLRFVPKFKRQMDTVAEAQYSLGTDASGGGLISKLKNAAKVLSVTVTWALENAIETADSMKSRGYGLKGRTAFSIYRFDDRDKAAMAYLIFCGWYVTAGEISSAFYFRYFPSVRGMAINAVTLSFQLVYLAMCAMPVVINVLEERKWKAIRLKM